MIFRYIQSVLHPERFHGHRQRAPFFEGWYFKLLDAAAQHRFAVIPGIFRGTRGDNDHAFVQILNGITGAAAYYSYPLSAFSAAEDAFDVHVGPNYFSAGAISLKLAGQEIGLEGDLTFEKLNPWPVTLRSPGIMGWYGWLPFMECYHGVVSLDHVIRGSLLADGRPVSFDGGRGYIEKDWGISFPSAYIWMQTNHFRQPGTSFTGSIAVIPWRGYSFPGFIVGLWHEQKLYRFATYTGAKVAHLSLTERHVNWTIMDHRYCLELQAERHTGGLLKAPIRTEMHKRVDETMQSRVDVRLTETSGRRQLVFEGSGENAALEVHGETGKLLTR